MSQRRKSIFSALEGGHLDASLFGGRETSAEKAAAATTGKTPKPARAKRFSWRHRPTEPERRHGEHTNDAGS